MSSPYTITEQKLIKLLGETNILIQSIDSTKINTIHPTYILQKRPLFETLYEDFLLEIRSAEEEERNDEKEIEKDDEKDIEKDEDGKKDNGKDGEEGDEFTKQNENTVDNSNSSEPAEDNKLDPSEHIKTLYIFTGDEPILQNLAEKSPALKEDFQRLFSIIKYYQKENIPTPREWIDVLFDGDEDERGSMRSRRTKNRSSMVKRFRRKFVKLLGMGGGD
ncbi:5617_t:CDS:1 [Acaulospora colombiana]|uniref:5617_t:CDS:1 n=1 Tax=Acaulospora colombiana TaxID=27376 RepID=A0ACA9LYV7_9GLOM|nr:5617_t:CDS:1 [Acaulospora colombiana]